MADIAADILREEGLQLTPEGLAALLASTGDSSRAAVWNAVLTSDLRTLGVVPHEKIESLSSGGSFDGIFTLPGARGGASGGKGDSGLLAQVVSVVDVNIPSKKQVLSDGSLNTSNANRLLLVRFTDGVHTYAGIEYQRFPSGGLSLATPSGTKFRVAVGTKIKRGNWLLTGENVTVLGGRVDTLYEAWKAHKEMEAKRRVGAAIKASVEEKPAATSAGLTSSMPLASENPMVAAMAAANEPPPFLPFNAADAVKPSAAAAPTGPASKSKGGRKGGPKTSDAKEPRHKEERPSRRGKEGGRGAPAAHGDSSGGRGDRGRGSHHEGRDRRDHGRSGGGGTPSAPGFHRVESARPPMAVEHDEAASGLRADAPEWRPTAALSLPTSASAPVPRASSTTIRSNALLEPFPMEYTRCILPTLSAAQSAALGMGSAAAAARLPPDFPYGGEDPLTASTFLMFVKVDSVERVHESASSGLVAVIHDDAGGRAEPETFLVNLSPACQVRLLETMSNVADPTQSLLTQLSTALAAAPSVVALIDVMGAPLMTCLELYTTTASSDGSRAPSRGHGRGGHSRGRGGRGRGH